MRFAIEWGTGTLRATRDLTPDIRLFEIVPEAGPRAFAPGAHLDVSVLVGGQPDTRSYSLVGEPQADHYRIAVKRRAESRGGSLYMWSLRPGARLTISAPKTSFEIGYEHPAYLLLAGGIGITPLVGMAARLKRRGAPLRFAYAFRSPADAAFADDLRALLGADLTLHCAAEGSRLDLAAAIGGLHPQGLCALCGPMTMLEEARRLWAEAGRPAANLRWETFGTSGRLGAQAFTVRIPRHGLELTVPASRSLLDALEEAGLDVLSDCRKGECGLCALEVLDVEGEIDHRDVFFSDHEKAAGNRLCACVSRAVGTLTLDTDYRPDAPAARPAPG